MRYIGRDFLDLHHRNEPTQVCGDHLSEVMTQTVVQLHSVRIKGSVNLMRTNTLQRVKKHHWVPLGECEVAALYFDMTISGVTLSVQTYWEVFHTNSRLNISPQLSGYRHPKWPEWFSPLNSCCCFCSTILPRGKTDMSVINISVQGDALTLTGCTLCLYLGCRPLSRDFPPKWRGVFRQFHSEQPVQVVAMTLVWCKQYVRNYFPPVGFCYSWLLPHRFPPPSCCIWKCSELFFGGFVSLKQGSPTFFPPRATFTKSKYMRDTFCNIYSYAVFWHNLNGSCFLKVHSSHHKQYIFWMWASSSFCILFFLLRNLNY